MRVFISGGSKSGKSSLAERLSQKMRKPHTPLYYLATMIPKDSEDEARILRHRQERESCGFETVESGRDILTVVGACDWNGVFLLDSVTALLANEMFGSALDNHVNPHACKKVADDLTKLISRASDTVIVSDYIYSDAFIYDELTELYRRGLAYIDRRMAMLCDVVLEACWDNYIIHKGDDIYMEFTHGFI